jgi:NTE family protein
LLPGFIRYTDTESIIFLQRIFYKHLQHKIGVEAIMKISLALSGGGFRATVFHLGVLARLAQEDFIQEVILLSTVSGGSLCAGLIYSLNGCQWPDSRVFLDQIEPQARHVMTTFDLPGSLIRRVFGTIWTILETRADDLSSLLQDHWKITSKLNDVPAKPRWMINATCYETGKNWRFERFRMGDYLFGYTNDTDLPISDALVASAGFPGLIGALELKTGGCHWFKYKDRMDPSQRLVEMDEEDRWEKIPIQPGYTKVHLWDGGVYDNHGLEGIHDFRTGWSNKFGFLIVSDAAGRSGEEMYKKGIPALMRITTGIMMNQVRSLRTRAILERLENHSQQDQGVFLQMGNTCKYILENSGHSDRLSQFEKGSMLEAEVHKAAMMATTIHKLAPEEYERLYHHGYEVADATLCAYYPQIFKHIPYSKR